MSGCLTISIAVMFVLVLMGCSAGLFSILVENWYNREHPSDVDKARAFLEAHTPPDPPVPSWREKLAAWRRR